MPAAGLGFLTSSMCQGAAGPPGGRDRAPGTSGGKNDLEAVRCEVVKMSRWSRSKACFGAGLDWVRSRGDSYRAGGGDGVSTVSAHVSASGSSAGSPVTVTGGVHTTVVSVGVSKTMHGHSECRLLPKEVAKTGACTCGCAMLAVKESEVSAWSDGTRWGRISEEAHSTPRFGLAALKTHYRTAGGISSP